LLAVSMAVVLEVSRIVGSVEGSGVVSVTYCSAMVLAVSLEVSRIVGSVDGSGVGSVAYRWTLAVSLEVSSKVGSVKRERWPLAIDRSSFRLFGRKKWKRNPEAKQNNGRLRWSPKRGKKVSGKWQWHPFVLDRSDRLASKK